MRLAFRFRRTSLAAALLVLLATFVAGSRPASAACGVCPLCDPPGSAAAAGLATTSAINARITLLEQAIILALMQHAGQLSNHLEALGTRIGNFQNVVMQQQKETSLEERSAALMLQNQGNSPNGCATITGLQGLDAANLGTRLIERDRTVVSLARDQNAPGTAAEGGAIADVGARYESWRTQYCNPAIYPEIGCSEATLRDGDIDTNLMLASLTLTEEGSQAATDLVYNLSNPVSEDPIPAAMLDTAEGREAFMRQRGILARREAARGAINERVAARAPSVQRGAWAAAARSLGEGAATSENISEHELMATLTYLRYQNPEVWMRDSADPADQQREALRLNRLLLMMSWKQYEMMERMLLVMSAGALQEIDNAELGSPGLIAGGEMSGTTVSAPAGQ